MKKNSGLFVKINYKLNGENKKYIRENSNRWERENRSKYLLCGGKYNRNGATIIFQVNNLSEAEDIINNNPFSVAKNYNYEILSKNYISLAM